MFIYYSTHVLHVPRHLLESHITARAAVSQSVDHQKNRSSSHHHHRRVSVNHPAMMIVSTAKPRWMTYEASSAGAASGLSWPDDCWQLNVSIRLSIRMRAQNYPVTVAHTRRVPEIRPKTDDMRRLLSWSNKSSVRVHSLNDRYGIDFRWDLQLLGNERGSDHVFLYIWHHYIVLVFLRLIFVAGRVIKRRLTWYMAGTRNNSSQERNESWSR